MFILIKYINKDAYIIFFIFLFKYFLIYTYTVGTWTIIYEN